MLYNTDQKNFQWSLKSSLSLNNHQMFSSQRYVGPLTVTIFLHNKPSSVTNLGLFVTITSLIKQWVNNITNKILCFKTHTISNYWSYCVQWMNFHIITKNTWLDLSYRTKRSVYQLMNWSFMLNPTFLATQLADSKGEGYSDELQHRFYYKCKESPLVNMDQRTMETRLLVYKQSYYFCNES